MLPRTAPRSVRQDEAHGDRGLQSELAAAYEKIGDIQGGTDVTVRMLPWPSRPRRGLSAAELVPLAIFAGVVPPVAATAGGLADAAASTAAQVRSTPSMARFLRGNLPWRRLVDLENIEIRWKSRVVAVDMTVNLAQRDTAK